MVDKVLVITPDGDQQTDAKILVAIAVVPILERWAQSVTDMLTKV